MPMRILVVDDEPVVRKSFARALQDDGFAAEAAADGQEALQKLQAERYDLVISDLKMPKLDGLELLRQVKATCPHTEFVILTGYGSIPNAVAAMREGAYNYITKPLNKHELLRIAREIAEKTELKGRVEHLQSELEERYGLHKLVGRSPAMQRVYDLIEKVSGSQCNVVITGESGTGKELVARALHYTGPRAHRRFVAVNCGALPESIVERELFGHERGAFTGAHRTQPGYFESADGGTLFLDEFTELSPGVQVKLLRVIEQHEIIRVGSTRRIPIDVRILAATNRDPEQRVAQGALREDLFYRLNVVTIALPPLRERREDIPMLVDHFLARCAEKTGQGAKTLAPATLEALIAHDWPGNVRELENVIEQAVTLCPRDVLQPDDLPELGGAGAAGGASGGDLPFPEAKRRLTEQFEHDAIVEALRSTGGNVTQAANELGMARSALQRLIKRHGLSGDDFREGR
ncbi:MAG: sigma-54-dependent transcriptional regulator [bacterium]